MIPLDIELYGILPYREALERQRAVRESLIAGETGERLLVLEHPPTVTYGRRTSPEEMMVAPKERVELEDIQRPSDVVSGLNDGKIDFVPVERGGRATYHAPGQLVIYPILDLRRRGLGVRDYLNSLQTAVVETLTALGLPAEPGRDEAGVWTDGRKAASFGIHMRRGVTMHGLALNINIDLRGFQWIRPCGLRPEQMTSLEKELDRPITREEVEPELITRLERRFGVAGEPEGAPRREL